MSSPKPVYIQTWFKGRVLTQNEGGGFHSPVMCHNAGFKGDEQKWIPEYGEEANTVALRCVANDKYLTAVGENYKPVNLGAKTWWKMSWDEVWIPNAFRLSVAGTPDKIAMQVANIQRPGNWLTMRTWGDDSEQYDMVFSFADANGHPGSAGSTGAAEDREALAKQEADNAAKQKALEEREAALAQKESDASSKQKALEDREEADKKASEEREAALAQKEKDSSAKQEKDNAAKQKAYEEREAALAQKEEDNAAKQKSVEDREAALSQKEQDSATNKKTSDDREAAFNQKEKDYSTNKKALEDREAAYTRQGEESAANEKSLKDREASLAKQERDCNADRKALKDREASLKQDEKDSAASKKTFEQRRAAFGQKEKDLAADRKALDDREAALTAKEKKRSTDWDKKMEELKGLRESSTQSKKPISSNPVGCGSKHYKPPRKLNRKVIGLVYE